MGQVTIGIPYFEVAPKPVGFIFFHFDVELAHGRRIFRHRIVVTVSRVVVIRIHASEQGVGRLVHEIGKDLVNRSFTRIGAGS